MNKLKSNEQIFDLKTTRGEKFFSSIFLFFGIFTAIVAISFNPVGLLFSALFIFQASSGFSSVRLFKNIDNEILLGGSVYGISKKVKVLGKIEDFKEIVIHKKVRVGQHGGGTVYTLFSKKNDSSYTKLYHDGQWVRVKEMTEKLSQSTGLPIVEEG